MAERNLDFDTVVDRRNTNCLKYDFAVYRGKPENVLPLWVADMDFKVSSYIEDAIINQARHGIYGYSEVAEEYFQVLKIGIIIIITGISKENGWLKHRG